MSFTKEQADALIASFNSISTEAQAIEVIEQMKEVLLETDTLDGSKSAMHHLANHLTDGLTNSPYKALFAPIMRLIEIHRVKDVNAQDKEGKTLLYWALKHGDKSSIDLLMLKYGADIDAPQNEDGDTLLHLAVKANDLPMVVRLLNEYGAKVDARDKQGNTALHCAVATGNFEIIKFLVKQKAEVNAKNILGATPLHFITEKTSIEMVEFLIKKGAEVNAKDNENYMPIHTAAKCWQVDAFEKLIKKHHADKHVVSINGVTVLHSAAANPKPDVARFLIGRCGIAADVQDKYGDNALYFAAESNSIDTFKYFMQEIGKKGKVDINRPGQDQLTLLHRAVRNDCLDIIKYLLEEEATLDLKDEDGNTALHLAVKNGHFKVVQHFVEVLKINVNVPTKEGVHPLHFAGRVRDIRIAQCLVEGGANIYAKTQSGGLPWHWAATKENFVVLEYLIEEAQKKGGFDINASNSSQRTALHSAAQGGRLEAVNFLHLRKAKLEAKDENGDMALHLAAEAGKCSVVEYFVNDCKMDINTRDGCGDSLLHLAVKSGDMETVEFLVQNAKQNKKFDVEVLGFHKKTPLHIAAEFGHLSIVKYLVNECKADVNTKDALNVTPLHLATEKGHVEVMRFLIELGADIDAQDLEEVEGVMEDHETPLHYAVAFSQVDAVRLLLKAGACKIIANANGAQADDFSKTEPEINELLRDFGEEDVDRVTQIYEEIFSIRVLSRVSSDLPDKDIVPDLKSIIIGYVNPAEFENGSRDSRRYKGVNFFDKKIIALVGEAFLEFVEKMDDRVLVEKIEASVGKIISLVGSAHDKAESRIYWSELKKEFKRIRQGKNICKSFMKVALAKIVPPGKLPSGPLASLESMLSILSASGQNPVSSGVGDEKEHGVVPMEVDDDVALAMSLETPLPIDYSDSNVDIKTMRVVETKSEKKEEQLPLPMSYPSSSSSSSSMSMEMGTGKVELKHKVPQLQLPSVVLQTVKQEDSRIPDAKTELAWVGQSANTNYGSNWWWTIKVEPIIKAESTAPESLKRKRESQEEGVSEEKGQDKRGRVVKDEYYGTTSTVGIFSGKSHENTRVDESGKPREKQVQVKKEPVDKMEL